MWTDSTLLPLSLQPRAGRFCLGQSRETLLGAACVKGLDAVVEAVLQSPFAHEAKSAADLVDRYSANYTPLAWVKPSGR